MRSIGLLLLLGVAVEAGAQPYQDASLPIAERVEDLLARMTLEEKAAQVVCVWQGKSVLFDAEGAFDAGAAQKAFPHGVGCIARPSDYSGLAGGPSDYKGAYDTTVLTNALQRWAMEDTRLGIPVLFHEEGLHGLQARDGTHFPQAIALAGTFDTELVERVYRRVGREIRARGVHHVLSPVVDVARDARWGRIEETYGEDPFLVSRMGVAAVRGFQGTQLPIGPEHVMATLKHMTGHGQPESGMNVGPAQIAERTLREVFFPPFETAIREAGAQAVMASYNEIDGVPSHANRWLLTDVLRHEWGFDGLVVADYGGIGELVRRHSVAAEVEDAARQALAAGVDIELPDGEAYLTLVGQVRRGDLSEAVLDVAARRVLAFKFQAGLFEHPMADPEQAERITGDAAARELALEAARKAIVLLKNDGVLPLSRNPGRIAVIGPHADDVVLGGYSHEPRQTVSILEGIRALADDVVYTEGARITDTRGWFADEVRLPDPAEDARRVDEAVAVAAESDVAVLVIGENEQVSREAWVESHLGDRASLQLIGNQQEMVERIVATGTPTVVVLNHGRPLAVTWIAEHVPAILDTWYLGQETGTAVAEALFGIVNPGARLPVTVPREVGQLPMFYNHKPTARRGYLFDSAEPLWPFGFGLSYTTFSYSEPSLSADTIAPDGSVIASVAVTNTGERAGDEVVQLYLRDDVSSVTRPVLELRGFERITLEAGETRTVSFELGPEDWRFYDRAMQRVVEPGTFSILIGPDSENLQRVTLTVQ
ncbi:MAG: glycoside hydrolase family 3 C-terminal domain-containing protein [Rhodothermales bacterium]|nr:glycoside hydrolase family 3 C-terminal domain-containing protein [Rhodothermales bacterium]MBO6780004.1 glycoside hydrolase family 3 C-terminal domain-containing protein [Rhodothermales bacterium]